MAGNGIQQVYSGHGPSLISLLGEGRDKVMRVAEQTFNAVTALPAQFNTFTSVAARDLRIGAPHFVLYLKKAFAEGALASLEVCLLATLSHAACKINITYCHIVLFCLDDSLL